MQNQQPLRWGILGPGIIAHRMADALRSNPESVLHSVASKTPDKAREFASGYENVQALSYDELVSHEEVDVVYVATTHNFHHGNAKLALEHGKHVLIEKPFTVNAVEARELAGIARDRKLFLMEAMWVRFLPVLQLLRSMLRSGDIGEIVLADLTFGGFVGPQYRERLESPELAGGATLDTGIYPISVVSYLLGEIPTEIKSMAKMSETGVDETVTCQFRYPSGVLASIKTSYNLRTERIVRVYGTTGYIEFPDFQGGETFRLLHHGGTNEIKEVRDYQASHGANGFTFQVEEVVRCVRSGQLESEIMPLDESISIMEVMDRMRAEWKFRYPFEKE